MNREKTSESYGKWPGGMDNIHADLQPEDRRIPAAVRRAVNVDFDVAGRVRRRSGYTQIESTAAHSLYCPDGWPFAVYVQGTQLRKLDETGTSVQIGNVEASRHFSWCTQAGFIYGSNGVNRVKISGAGVALPWGVADPGGQPSVAPVSTGGMDAGLYQVAVTFMDSFGEESGAENSVVCEVPAGGGIALSSIPQPPAGTLVSTVRIYCSRANGEVEYFAADLPVGTTSYTLGDFKPGRVLETSLHTRVVPSQLVRAYRGRIYMAVGKTLYYTQALRYGLLKLHECSLRFPDNIQGVAVTTGGLFVGTDKLTYFLAGDDPKKMQLRPAETYGILPRTELTVRGTVFGAAQAENTSAVWWNTNSVLCRGNSDGTIIPLTAGRLALPSYTNGATLLREIEGVRQLISTLRGPGEDSAFAARDIATAEVVRNGVLI